MSTDDALRFEAQEVSEAGEPSIESAAQQAVPIFTVAVIGITLINFGFFSAYLLFFPTLPFFIERLGGAKSEIGLLIAVSSLSSLALRPAAGYLVDAIGRRQIITLGLAIFVVNALAYNFAVEPWMLIPVRVLAGASLAMFVTAASTYIADVAPAARRAEVMSYYGIANSLAFAIGPALGGFLIHGELFEGLDSFLVDRFEWAAGSETGDLHFATLFLFAAGVAAVCTLASLALPVSREAAPPVARRLSPSDLFLPQAIPLALINFTSSFVFAAMVSFLPLFARDRGLDNAGLLFIVYAGGLIGLRLIAGHWMDRLPRVAFIVPGILVLAVAMVVLTAARGVPELFVAVALYGIGAGLFQPAAMALLVDRVQPAVRGRALSTFTLGSDLGLSAGSFSLGIIIDAAGFRAGFMVGAGVAVAGALLFFVHSRGMAKG